MIPLKKNIFSSILIILFGITITAYAGYIEDLRIDFPGQYCQRNWAQQRCCPSRQDNCSVPISTTLCYCDDFCKRDRGPDCCPDYLSWCKGEIPDPIITCKHKGRFYYRGDKFRDNCNNCECISNGSVECELDVCLQDHEIIDNINRIQRLNWSARNYTEFWGKKFKDGIISRLGTLEPTFRVKSMSRLTNRVGTLPRHFNSLEEWPQSYFSEIRDQGWCGSSWVMSTTSVASDRFAIQSKGKEIVKLAPQNILSCANRQRGCNGGHLDAAWRFIHKQGVVDEECYPYEARVTECKVRRPFSLRQMGCTLQMRNRVSSKVERDHFYAMGPAYSINNETDIMMEIKQSGPVQATMRVYRDFFSYNNGIYRHTAASRDEKYGFHSVKLVGWGEDRVGYNIEKYWIAANSWGEWWGENGYFRILRGDNECLIEDYVLASIPHVL